MRMEWDDDSQLPGQLPQAPWQDMEESVVIEDGQRLDFLLPNDSEYGVVSASAAQIYLEIMLHMVNRHGQSLAILYVALDPSPLLTFLGDEGQGLIGRAVARCLRQETRGHDVVARAPSEDFSDEAEFIIICPLLTEKMAAALAERMMRATSTYAADPEKPWPSLSIGVAALSIDAAQGPVLLGRAKEAMRRARRNGGRQVWRHSDTLRTLMEEDPGTERS